MSSNSPLSPAGRLGRGSFAVGATIVYVVSFLSQVLLSAPVVARAGPLAFIVVQAVLIWAWYVLHARRLRDAGRRSGVAIGIVVVYTLAIVLLVMIVTSTGSATPAATGAAAGGETPSLLSFFLVIYLLAILTAEPSLGMLAWLLIGVAALLLTPIVIAFAFSIWTAIRPPVPAPAPA